jgi:uncharacterized membrane protein YqjE
MVLYLEARQRLLAIEADEARVYFSCKLTQLVTAVALLAFGYGLFLAGGIMLLVGPLEVPWYGVCLGLAPLHLLLGWLFLRLARRPPQEPLFKESANELAKDREWLSNPRKP